MSSRYGAPARLIWSLAGSGLGTTIAASGNSGAWPIPPYQPTQQNNMTPVDLRDVEDLWITAMCASVSGGTPSLAVNLNVFDDTGNAWLAAAVGAITAGGIAAGKQLSVGKHGLSAGNFVVFPSWGQIAWAYTAGPGSFNGVDISVWAR